MYMCFLIYQATALLCIHVLLLLILTLSFVQDLAKTRSSTEQSTVVIFFEKPVIFLMFLYGMKLSTLSFLDISAMILSVGIVCPIIVMLP
jgi:hypothetical protein